MIGVIATPICAGGIVNHVLDLPARNSKKLFLQKFSKYSNPRRLRCCRKRWRKLGAKSGTRLDWIDSERERLGHGERKAQELVDRSYGKHPRVYDHAVEKLEDLLKEKQQFEQKTAIERQGHEL